MQADKDSITRLAQDYSIETTPRGYKKLRPLADYLPAHTAVYITHLPGAPFADTVLTAEAVKEQGFRPVPHVAVRNLKNAAELETGLLRLNKAGIGDILLLAGGAGKAGAFNDTLEILDSGFLEQFELHSIGFAGHPEGHPFVPQAEIDRALAVKSAYAAAHPRDYYLMTQFCFTAAPIIRWAKALQAQSIRFPLILGIPGVAGTAAMIKHAQACGVGASLNFLMKNGGLFRKLLGGVAEPNQLVAELAASQADGALPASAKLHFYPLGDFQRTSDWANAAAAGRFTLHPSKGIRIEH